MHSRLAPPIEIHDMPVDGELLHDVMAIFGGMYGFNQIAFHGVLQITNPWDLFCVQAN